MEGSDPKLVGALIGAAASIGAAALAFLAKLFSDHRERRRRDHSHLMAIRNEIAINLKLANVMQKNQRMVGLRFFESVWQSADTSSIYRRSIPWDEILDLYSDFYAFNALAERRVTIEGRKDYPDREQRIAAERVEASKILERIADQAPAILKSLKARRV